jgi:hypothetical protein
MRGAALALVLAAGCASLPDDGALMCNPDPARRCPSGFQCADDGRCYRDGHLPGQDMSIGDLGDNSDVDMAAPPGSDLAGTAADMTVVCGHAGQECCGAPFSPCVTGTTCSSSSMLCEANDVWVFGTDVNISAGTILPIGMHYDGTSWTLTADFAPINSGQNGFGIWGNSPSNYFAVADKGNIFEYIGSNMWLVCHDPSSCPGSGTTTAQLTNVYGANSSDIWVSGGGSMLHFEGGQWFPRANGLPASTYWNVSWASAPTDVWTATGAGVARWNGTAWTLDTTVTSARAIWGSSASDVWVVGDTGLLKHWNGSAWSQNYAVDGQATAAGLLSISGSATNDIWAVGSHIVASMTVVDAFHWDGTAWHSYPAPSGVLNGPSAVWTASPKQAWVVEGSDIWYWNGTAWTQTALAAAQKKTWNSVYGSANGGK